MTQVPALFFNRELSWLGFNQRVLQEALDPKNPPLERLKFFAIAASNLDEFFMVRVGGLQLLRKAGIRRTDPAGLTPRMQLQAIRKKTVEMMKALSEGYLNELEPLLAEGGLRRFRPEALSSVQEKYLAQRFAEELYPALTPAAIPTGQDRPFFRNLQLYMLVRLAPEAPDQEDRFAVLPLSKPFDRLIVLPVEGGHGFILLEDWVRSRIAAWFNGVEVLECAAFRVTRNADIALREENASDLLEGMLSILEERHWSDCVRIEVESGASRVLCHRLCAVLDATPEQLFRIDGPLDLGALMPLSQTEGFERMKAPEQTPQISSSIDPHRPLFEQIAEGPRLLYHPYESFDPVIRLIREAAEDPEVLAIKQVLYRTASGSPIIAALQEAAAVGKAVTALVELKARFDEERNIVKAQQLEQAGVQVVYGVQGLKTHAKVCLIIRREPRGIVRYIHYGTGNYNESTSRIYSDVSLMTCDEALGHDASVFFNAVCGYAQPDGLQKLCMAPLGLRDRLVELIDGEIRRCRQGRKGLILLKMNSLTDSLLIRKLYEAAQAGVRIKLNVRGICCLRPGLPGLSTSITVTSIVGRYLEHARIFYFHRGGEEQVYIASADWMPRNLDRRVELLIPVENRTARSRLVEILKTHCADTVKSWTLLPDGTYVRTALLPGTKNKIDSQQIFYTQAVDAAARLTQPVRTALRPHRPAKTR